LLARLRSHVAARQRATDRWFRRLLLAREQSR